MGVWGSKLLTSRKSLRCSIVERSIVSLGVTFPEHSSYLCVYCFTLAPLCLWCTPMYNDIRKEERNGEGEERQRE